MNFFNLYIWQAFLIVVLVSGIPLIVSAVSGLFVSFIQTVFQLSEQTFVYLVKVSSVIAILFFGGSFFLSKLILFMSNILESIQYLG